MSRYDCVILYNCVAITEALNENEVIYPATVIRDEVGAVEESLRAGGFNPYVLAVEHFSRDVFNTLIRIAPRFVFNLCEEINHRCELEMCVAGLLDLMGIPYTGSGPLALGLALNKFRVKKMLRSFNIPTARGYLHPPGENSCVRNLGFPVIVKPVHEDGSLGIGPSSVCKDSAGLREQVKIVHDIYRQSALVEEYLDGREFNVSILGDGRPEILAISEIDFSGMPPGMPRIVSYQAKWDEDSPLYRGTVPVCPARIPGRLESRVRDLAVRSFRAVGCRDYARIDMRTDAEGRVRVLEVNPNPDIGPKAGFARAARAAGYTYTDMVLRISEFALARGAQVASPAYAL
ncbi:MAG: ATP-grasp domain-containing protein [Acidobacteria bacterium]|nr:ATP-grasp domain-containing protein [Acidobacteriota bacterium]